MLHVHVGYNLFYTISTAVAWLISLWYIAHVHCMRFDLLWMLRCLMMHSPTLYMHVLCPYTHSIHSLLYSAHNSAYTASMFTNMPPVITQGYTVSSTLDCDMIAYSFIWANWSAIVVSHWQMEETGEKAVLYVLREWWSGGCGPCLAFNQWKQNKQSRCSFVVSKSVYFVQIYFWIELSDHTLREWHFYSFSSPVPDICELSKYILY